MSTVGGSYSYNAFCDVCGFQFKAGKLRKRWDGLMVCDADFEVRHPMDFYRVRNDHHKLPFTRSEPIESTGFLPPNIDFYTDTANNLVDAVGQKFTVGSADRRLMAVKFVRGTTDATAYPVDAPITVKLWNQAGSLLTSWTITSWRYDRENDYQATAIIPLSPVYILETGETYTISVFCTNDNALRTHTTIPGGQLYLTFVGTRTELTDVFPNNVSTDCAYMDVITGSTN